MNPWSRRARHCHPLAPVADQPVIAPSRLRGADRSQICINTAMPGGLPPGANIVCNAASPFSLDAYESLTTVGACLCTTVRQHHGAELPNEGVADVAPVALPPRISIGLRRRDHWCAGLPPSTPPFVISEALRRGSSAGVSQSGNSSGVSENNSVYLVEVVHGAW